MLTNELKTGSYVTSAAITNPNRPKHQMVLEPINGTVTATVGDRTIASSSRALLVRERAQTSFEPVVYFPPEDVRADLLTPVQKTTVCPLKGTASYYDVRADSRITEAAWQYKTVHAFDPRLAQLECHVAFDRNQITVTPSTFDLDGAQQ